MFCLFLGLFLELIGYEKGGLFAFSPIDRYVKEFAGRQNQMEMDTIDQMRHVAKGMAGKRLKFKDLILTHPIKRLRLPSEMSL